MDREASRSCRPAASEGTRRADASVWNLLTVRAEISVVKAGHTRGTLGGQETNGLTFNSVAQTRLAPGPLGRTPCGSFPQVYFEEVARLTRNAARALGKGLRYW